ncbi:MAG: flavin-containing monooxygenase, partial [Actinomycetes bacterium]
MTGTDSSDSSAFEAARERYEAERTKRLREEGLAQYDSLKDHDLDRDPWADPNFTRDPIAEDTEVVILGGGFAGMLAGINLTKRGIADFRILEKAADFGGTWYWNRYPGCMCDVDATIYLPLLEETGYMPTEKYASASEIFGYCQLLGRHFDLYDRALFQTEVDSLTWDEDAGRWQVVTQRGDRIRARYFIAAGGLMHKAKLPGIEGIDEFAGKAFHTTRWDYDFTGGSPTEPMDHLADKTVGIIGTGATAVQVVPQLAKSAKAVYVFQRTPSAVGVRGQQPIDEEWFRSLPPGWQRERTLNFTSVATGQQPEVDLVADGWGQALKVDTQRDPADDADRLELEKIDFEVM